MGSRGLPAHRALAKLGTRQAGPDTRSANLELLGRSPKRNTVGSDQAFWGNLAFEGNYNGFRIINVKNPSRPEIVSDVDCRGPQNDVTVWGSLLFLSVDRPQTTDSCDNSSDVQIDPKDPSTWTGFEGIRIIDVSNPRDPEFIKGVETDCGSHTATLVPDLKNGRVLLYVSSYPLIPGPHCGPGKEADPRHGKISVVVRAGEVDRNVALHRGVATEVLIGLPGAVDRHVGLGRLHAPRLVDGGPVRVTLPIYNRGNVHRDYIGPDRLVADAGGKRVPFPDFTVLRDSTRLVSAQWQPPLACVCHLRVVGDDGSGHRLVATATVVVFPFRLTFGVAALVLGLALLSRGLRRRSRRAADARVEAARREAYERAHQELAAEGSSGSQPSMPDKS